VIPREWFLVPLFVVNEVVDRIKDGTITGYRYDPKTAALMRIEKTAFEALPVAIRNLGPWTGSKEGEVGHVRLPLRSLLSDQGFVCPREQAQPREPDRHPWPASGQHGMPRLRGHQPSRSARWPAEEELLAMRWACGRIRR
jgi:hypothetical protein